MHYSILVIVGTQSGNAAMVAEMLAAKLGEPECFRVELLPEQAIPDTELREYEVVLVCTSTHGDGELPDCLRELYRKFEIDKPDLGHLLFGVVCLGDSTYHQTFCAAGMAMRDLFLDLGAQLVAPILKIDASNSPLPDEPALQWVETWIANLLASKEKVAL